MYANILIATDGSDAATTAANQGLAIAEELDTTVNVLSVADVRDGARWKPVQDLLQSNCQEYVDAIARTAMDRGIPVQTAVREGRPHQEILAYAQECGADLLVLGTHGRTGVRRWLLGSVVTSVIRESRRPVLTVNVITGDIPRRFDKILIATDGRSGASTAIDYGIALAEAYDATVHAVYAVDDTISRLSAVLEEFERVGTQATTDVAVRAAGHGVDVVRSLERGIPHRAIIDYATDHYIDLIVVGTEGRTGLDRLAFGSVSQRVVSISSVPVLTVRSTA
jgi:nucleotide-binding universal stress UspA family protein